jgi:uncharacterized protein YecA (UPF0149 family)
MTLATFHEVAGSPDDARSTRDRLQAWPRESGWISATVHPVRSGPKIGRNHPCPCGSGRKHKHCCGR